MSVFKMPSGKYTGLTIPEINQRDPDYVIKWIWKSYGPQNPHFRTIKQELQKVIDLESLHLMASEKRIVYGNYIAELNKFINTTFENIEDVVKYGPPYLTGQFDLLRNDVKAGHIPSEKFMALSKAIAKKELNIQEKYFAIWSRILYSETFLMFKEL
jgi:hypothetical protein